MGTVQTATHSMTRMSPIAIPLLLLAWVEQAWAAEPSIDPARLQEQIERQAEQASMTPPLRAHTALPGPEAFPGAPAMSQGHAQGRPAEGGYGWGYERRYGAPGKAGAMGRGLSSSLTGGMGRHGMSAGSGGGHGRR